MGLKRDIKKVLKEYGCLHKGGKLWDKVIRKQRNNYIYSPKKIRS